METQRTIRKLFWKYCAWKTKEDESSLGKALKKELDRLNQKILDYADQRALLQEFNSSFMDCENHVLKAFRFFNDSHYKETWKHIKSAWKLSNSIDTTLAAVSFRKQVDQVYTDFEREIDDFQLSEGYSTIRIYKRLINRSDELIRDRKEYSAIWILSFCLQSINSLNRRDRYWRGKQKHTVLKDFEDANKVTQKIKEIYPQIALRLPDEKNIETIREMLRSGKQLLAEELIHDLKLKQADQRFFLDEFNAHSEPDILVDELKYILLNTEYNFYEAGCKVLKIRMTDLDKDINVLQGDINGKFNRKHESRTRSGYSGRSHPRL